MTFTVTTSRGREIAKFFCGFEAFHALFHAYLWRSGSTFSAFGVSASASWNACAFAVHVLVAAALGWFGWRWRQRAG